MMPLLLSFLSLFVSIAISSTEGPVVYGISPLYLSYGHDIPGLKAIEKRLPEIEALGANIIWLQPVTPPFEEDGHGYDVMDYYSVWNALGTDQDMKNLVKTAHAKKIKVMLDVVLNHSSEEHPFVKEIQEIGLLSRYYNFYQHAPVLNIPYSQHFNIKNKGNVPFVFYFWEHLLNFNYDSSELRAYMIDVLTSWVKRFDIDGFRFDASWGPSSRYPQFYPEISRALRKVKPSLILMAEDMAGYPVHYKNTSHKHLKDSGFNWAYDWNNSDPFWISKWSFQSGEDVEETAFNTDPVEGASHFAQALTYTIDSDVLPVRYIENNDTPGSLLHHSVKESKFAAAAMFLLPGVPLVFYGQEAGNSHETFELPSFDPSKKMSSYNPELWKFYRALIRLRKESQMLSFGKIENIILQNEVVSFDRVYEGKKIQVKLNFKTKKITLNGKPILSGSM